MAKFIFTQNQLLFYPKAYNRVGRNSAMVDTLVELPKVSRIHAVIEWENRQWIIRDLSMNGIWLNGKRMASKSSARLQCGDRIILAGESETEFTMLDDSAPFDYLHGTNNAVIPLQEYNFLPSEDSAEVVLYYHPSEQVWHCEYVNLGLPFVLSEQEKIQLQGQEWQLRCCQIPNSAATTPAQSDPFEYVFNVSQDEEETSIVLHSTDQHIDLNARSHHYLTMLLARYKLQHLQQGIADSINCGWIPAKQLERDLGLSENHLNIQVHRARKQFVEELKTHLLTHNLIERSRGKLRFSGARFTIYKGGKLEGSSLDFPTSLN